MKKQNLISIDLDPRAQEDASAAKFLDGVKATLTERASTYPAYSEEAQRVAEIWNVLVPANPLRPSDIPMLMMITKLVRNAGGNSPDSLVDLVGYSARLQSMKGV